MLKMEAEDWEAVEEPVAQTTSMDRALGFLAENLVLNPGSATYHLWDLWKSLNPSRLDFFLSQLR